MVLSVIMVSLLGVALSLYSYLLEKTLAKNPTFKPLCDLSDKISCTAPLKSPYSHMLGVSNAIWGMLFYTCVILLALKDLTGALVVVSLIGVVYSIYLASLLIFKIRAWCLVCSALYLVNAILCTLSTLLYLYQ